MGRRMTYLVLSLGFPLLSFGCATKGYVREQVNAAEERTGRAIARQDEEMARQEAQLYKLSGQLTAERQRIEGLDTKVWEVGLKTTEAATMAQEAKAAADQVASTMREVEARLTKKFGERNRYQVVETKTLTFDFGRADLKDEAITALLEVARVLKEDVNAIVELQGHTDSVGSDQFNLQLSRARVDAVIRHLVQLHGIELHRIHAVGLGEAVPVADNKTKEGRAKNRRVMITVLTSGDATSVAYQSGELGRETP